MPVVLVVDDGAANREVIRLFLSTIDCEVRLAEDGPTALDMIETAPPDLVLLDVRMPRMDGYEVCRRIKAMPRGRLLPVVMITGLSQTTHRVMALEAGADDFMAKPVEGAELIARVRSALRLKELYNTLDSAEHVIFSLATAVEAKDSFTEQHTQRVGESARLLGERLGLSEQTLDVLYRGGIIHDIGKIGVSDSILHKPGPLDPVEVPQMQAHVAIGESIVKLDVRAAADHPPPPRALRWTRLSRRPARAGNPTGGPDRVSVRCVRRAGERPAIPDATLDRGSVGGSSRWIGHAVGPGDRRPARQRAAHDPTPGSCLISRCSAGRPRSR